MAKYRVTSPSGQSFIVTAPDDATPEQVQAFAQQNFPKAQPQPGVLDRINGVVDAAGTLATNAIGGTIGRVGGTIGAIAGQIRQGELGSQEGAARAAETAQDAQKRLTVAPGTKEGADLLDRFGKAVDATKIEGMGPMAVPAAQVGNEAAALSKAPVRQAVGTAGKIIGERRAAGAAQSAQETANQAARVQSIIEARKAGFKLPPSQATTAVTPRAVEGFVARTAPTERVFSLHNSKVVDSWIKQDIGLKPTDVIGPKTFDQLRADAGQAYGAVKSVRMKIKPDSQLKADIEKVKTSDYGQAASRWEGALGNEKVDNLVSQVLNPKGGVFTPSEAIEFSKELRRRATKNIKAWDDLEKQDLGYAQRAIAEALENQVGRALEQTGQKGLIENFRAARQRIAKLYDAESAWDGSNFVAKEFAKKMDKGAPLTGGMEKVAKFAQNFPKVAQEPSKIAQKSGFSQYDAAAGVLGDVVSGSPFGLMAAGVPYATQRALLYGEGLYGPSLK